MVWFKSCPRCKRGDLRLLTDSQGAKYIECLQCGHVLSEIEEAPFLGRKVDVADVDANPRATGARTHVYLPHAKKIVRKKRKAG